MMTFPWADIVDLEAKCAWTGPTLRFIFASTKIADAVACRDLTFPQPVWSTSHVYSSCFEVVRFGIDFFRWRLELAGVGLGG